MDASGNSLEWRNVFVMENKKVKTSLRIALVVQKVRNTLNQVAGLLTNWQKVYYPMTISSSVERNEYETKLGNSPARVTLMQQYFRDDLARLKIYYYDLDTTNSLDVSRRANVLNQVIAQIHAITDYQSAHKLEAYDFIA